ncbi:MAG: DUF2070 family protein [Candidatus Bathyarchaeota archaeon]|nr:DUF2070 family protein [Candidatus Bathyarchaeota archaeon]
MNSADALNDDINKAVKRYSSLFSLPSYRTVTIWLFVGSLFVGVLAVLPVIPSFQGVLLGFAVGVIVFILATLADFAINLWRLESDSVLNLRRCFALSLYSNIIWILFIVLGGFSYLFLNDLGLWLRLLLLGLCAMIILRLLVLSAISFGGSGRIVLYSIMQPGLYAIALVSLQGVLGHVFTFSTWYFFTSSLFVGVLAASCFMFFLNRMGTRTIGEKLLSVLKAFMANWAEDLNEPLEALLEKLSIERSIRLPVIMFRARGKAKAVIVVPTFHPGPFKNVGSSALPYLIQKELENKLKCVVSVPHGLSGHDVDLTSQAQNQKIIAKISHIDDMSDSDRATTHFVRVQKDGANSSCQIFGKCALFTLTLAPQTMEDLPSDLDSFITQESGKRGLSMAITIDAHNSIEGSVHLEREISSLEKAAVESLETALKSQKGLLEVGAANIVPPDLSAKDGMGPGGISVTAVKVKDQLTAYVTIDGNNMISGLRERILQKLDEIGFTDGEVLTTDTHAVNGIVLTPRGYHPLGEAIDPGKLIEYVTQAATKAKSNLESAEAVWLTKEIPNVRVIGERYIEILCVLVEKGFLRAKRLATIIFPLVGLIWTTLLIIS